MKRFIPLLILCLLHAACRNEHTQRVMLGHDGYEEPDRTSYPVLIEGGTKIIYQFGHLTADKGLKLYLDTIPHDPAGFKLDESMRRRLSLE